MTINKTYTFLLDDPHQMVEDLLERFQMIANFMINRGIMARWIKSFNSYYGYYYVDRKSAYGMGTAGPQGELSTVVVNEYRNLLQHILALFTQNKISIDAIPFTSDVEGRNASIVANALLEYIISDPNHREELLKMAEIGLVFGTTFVTTIWDQHKNLIGIDGDMNPVFSGELLIKTYTPLDVILEAFKERYQDQEWVCTRDIVNRFDLISIYPHLEKDILNLPRVQDTQLADPYFICDDVHVWLYTLYHKATPTIPFGRYTLFGSKDVVLKDFLKNPYCKINPKTGLPLMSTGVPISCFRPAKTLGTAWGHTVGFDLLPLQDMKNMSESTIASNQACFGVQNLVVARGTNMDFADVGNGLRVLELDLNPELGPGGGVPSVLELLKTPPEIFNQSKNVSEAMERLSGINGALRGTPPPQVSSGTAMALLTTQAQTFNTPIENVYIDCLENIANNVLNIIATFMPYEDLIPMVGLKDEYAIPYFKAEELSKIKTIKILTGNAMSKSPAGRLAMAQDMINSGLVSPTEYVEVATTGTIKNKQEDVTAQDALIQWENQQLIQGKQVQVALLDNHLKHILGHAVTINHPDVRNNTEKMAVITKHILEHDQQWVILSRDNPQLLALITGSPIPPEPPSQQGGGQGGQPQPPPPSSNSGHQMPPQAAPHGIAKNNIQNASTPGGVQDLAASGMRSASKLLRKQ